MPHTLIALLMFDFKIPLGFLWSWSQIYNNASLIVSAIQCPPIWTADTNNIIITVVLPCTIQHDKCWVDKELAEC